MIYSWTEEGRTALTDWNLPQLISISWQISYLGTEPTDRTYAPAVQCCLWQPFYYRQTPPRQQHTRELVGSEEKLKDYHITGVWLRKELAIIWTIFSSTSHSRKCRSECKPITKGHHHCDHYQPPNPTWHWLSHHRIIYNRGSPLEYIQRYWWDIR